MALAMGKEVSAAASELISGERRGGDLVVTFSRFLPPLCISQPSSCVHKRTGAPSHGSRTRLGAGRPPTVVSDKIGPA